MSSTPVLALNSIERVYPGPPAVRALQSCSIDVSVGEHVSIMGPSGSGKSTLLNIIGLLDRPTAGHYSFDGMDTVALSEAERATIRGRGIGFVFQAFHLLPHRSTVENIVLALTYAGIPRSRRRSLAEEALDAVGIAHRAAAVPTELSGGERQRVAIARALAVGPRLLLCDEPTGNLDTVTAEGIIRLVQDLHADGMTIVMITHNPAVAAVADRRFTITDGVLAADLGGERP